MATWTLGPEDAGGYLMFVCAKCGETMKVYKAPTFAVGSSGDIFMVLRVDPCVCVSETPPTVGE